MYRLINFRAVFKTMLIMLSSRLALTAIKLGNNLFIVLREDHRKPGGGGYSHIHAIWVCAAVKGMVFKLFSLG